MKSSMTTKTRLIIRNATLEDVSQINQLLNKVYPEFPKWEDKVITSQIEHFPHGQFVVTFDNRVIGYCSTIRVAEEVALKPHTWDVITGKGYCTTHNPSGNFLYGVEACVDPDFRDQHIGQRIYTKRKELCSKLHLKGIITGGRMNHFAEKKELVKTPEKYIEKVQNGEILDHTLLFQLHNGFEVMGILKKYLPEDKESMGYASHLVWHNPELVSPEKDLDTKLPRRKHFYLDQDHVRVAAIQYKQRSISSFDEFAKHVEYFVQSVAEYRTDFVLFPESFTMQLLSINNFELPPELAIHELSTYTDHYKEMMTNFAIKHNINIIGGSIATKMKDGIQNISYIFLRDGSIHAQAKIHPTPDEREVWHMKGANKVDRIITDCGPIGVLICYDSEFPELTRHLIDQGIYILFVPFCTDQRLGYLRIRYSAHARAVENQCYVAIAGNVGNLPGVFNMNVQYAQSCILTPCDFPFARDGIAADTTPNVEMIAIADLNIKTLIAARNTGSVINLKDRRSDLYSVVWHEKDNNGNGKKKD